ncbi:MAG TPA: dihydrofolate reductase [Myxococcota bacterium]|nr:dihydrofolate reductase [Myxococcota bacterium]
MLSLIAAVAENGVIGAKGGLPWRLPDEMAHFKRSTLGKPVVMGRRTFESLRRPLADRPNVVLSHAPDFAPPGVRVARDLDAALALVAGAPEVVVIGGAALYAEALPRAQRVYLTRVHAAPEGDVYFPKFELGDWRETVLLEHPADARHAYAFTICQLDRK